MFLNTKKFLAPSAPVGVLTSNKEGIFGFPSDSSFQPIPKIYFSATKTTKYKKNTEKTQCFFMKIFSFGAFGAIGKSPPGNPLGPSERPLHEKKHVFLKKNIALKHMF